MFIIFLHIYMLKDYNNLSYAKDYFLLNIFNDFRAHKQPIIKKVVIYLSSNNCVDSLKELTHESRIDETFHSKVMSLLKVFDPKNVLFTPGEYDERFFNYFCNVTLNDKEEIWYLVKSLVYEHNLLKRLEDESALSISHINNHLKKISVQFPVIELKDIAYYSLANIKDFEIKTIFVNFDFYISI